MEKRKKMLNNPMMITLNIYIMKKSNERRNMEWNTKEQDKMLHEIETRRKAIDADAKKEEIK